MAARDDLGNLLDEVDVGDQLRAALTEVASDVSVAGNRDLALVLDAATLLEDDIEEWRYAAIRAGGELIERAQATFDGRTAWDLAERLLPLFNDEAALQYRDILYSVVDAAAQWTGPRAVFSEKLSAVIRRLRDPAEELEDTERRRELARAIGRLGNVVSVLDGPAAARPIHEEEEELCRALVKEQPTPDARRELGIALTHLGDLVEVLDGQAAVRPQREEIKRIFSALAEEQPTPEARRELALAVGRLGDVVEFLDGPTASKPLREEAQQIHRALAEEQPTPEARRDLAITVGRLGDVVEALDGPAAARSLREETENILRALAEEQPTPKARQDLAGAISQLGDLVEALDGLAAARSLHEEAENILRALAEEQPTLRTRSDLANALGNLGNVVEALDGPVAALPPLRESEGLHRALVDEQSTLETRRGLANTLGRLGSMLWAINGPDAARSYFEEVEKIYRKEVEEQPSSGALSSHANTLSWLARLLYDSGDLNAAQQVWEEGIQDALSAYRSDPSANTELRVLSDRSRLLQAQMLGPQPWQRPFAVEDLPMQSPRTLKELQSLMSSFRAWASKTDAITAAGWNEGMQIDFARCALAAGDARGALATLIASADAMRDALSTKPHDLAELATRHALTTGICAATAGEIDLGLDAFSRAAEINIPRQDRSPLALRYSAAIGWYHAALLREMGREAESASCFNSGHAAALSFARFEMMDGKAILHAFENFAA